MRKKTRLWADAQRDGRPAEYAICESSVIPFLVPRRKVWLTTTARRPCSNVGNIGERKKIRRKVNFAPRKIPLRGSSPQTRKPIYNRVTVT